MTANEADPADVAEQQQPAMPDDYEDDTPLSEDFEANEADVAEQARTVPDEPDDEG